MATPLAVVAGHSKAVSYVRFLGGDRLVTASTDSRLKLWHVPTVAASCGRARPSATYTGEKALPSHIQMLGTLLCRWSDVAC